jgi:hypothetical protein
MICVRSTKNVKRGVVREITQKPRLIAQNEQWVIAPSSTTKALAGTRYHGVIPRSSVR